MKTFLVMMAVLVFASLVFAGCSSQSDSGYSTYSPPQGGAPAAGGGGGCGRFTASDSAVSVGEIKEGL